HSQRYVPLTFQAGSGALTVNTPANGNIAPPGPYMLFLVDTAGVPSVAAMTRLPTASEDTQPPTAPGSLAATGAIGRASLTWTASTDNVAVTGYNVHRSTTSGFAPTSANRVGQTTTATSFADSSMTAAGTYFYVVVAKDARGNLSAPSNQAAAT